MGVCVCVCSYVCSERLEAFLIMQAACLAASQHPLLTGDEDIHIYTPKALCLSADITTKSTHV